MHDGQGSELMHAAIIAQLRASDKLSAHHTAPFSFGGQQLKLEAEIGVRAPGPGSLLIKNV